MVERLHDQIGDRPTYLSIEIDVLDSVFIPATATPESAGLDSRELLRRVGRLAGLAGVNLGRADVGEVAPVYDNAEITSVATANLAYEFVSLMASGALHATSEIGRAPGETMQLGALREERIMAFATVL